MKRILSSLLLLVLSATTALALQQSTAPPKFGIPWGASAGVPYINSIPVPSQIGIVNCRASLTDGFPPLTFTPGGAGGCPPFGADWNGILKQITQWSQWQAAGGPVYYDSAFATASGGYPNGAILMSAIVPGDMWMSTADNNTTNPDAGGAGWVQAPGQIPIGTPVPSLTTTIPTGSVSANGMTIGNASSNATNRANADTFFLFSFIWSNCPNTICAIYTSTGSVSTRGANAAVDYAANKAIATYLMNGRGVIGADSQHGTSSSFLSGVPVQIGSTTSPGSTVGENLHSLASAENGAHTHSNTLSDPGHSHGVTGGIGGSNGILSGTGTGAISALNGFTSIAISPAATGIVINNASSGSGAGHNTVELNTLVYWNLKL